MKNLKVSVKLLISFGVVILFTLVVGAIGIFNAGSLTSEVQDDFIMASNTTLQNYLKSLEDKIGTEVLLAAEHRDVIDGLVEFLATGKRQKINDAVISLVQYSDADFFTVTDAQGKVVMRSNQPTKFGDSNADLEHIKVAMGGRKSVAYETTPENPIALHGGLPIMYNGKQIGVAGGGYNMDTEVFVDKLKSFTGSEVSMFLGDTRVATTFHNGDGKRIIGTKADGAVAKRVLSGDDYKGKSVVSGKNLLVHYSPIRYADGRVFGMKLVAIDLTKTQRNMTNAIIVISIIVFVLGVSAVIIGLYIAGNIAKPLNAAVIMINEVGRGYLDGRLNLDRGDEIGVMAKTLDMFVDSLRKLIIDDGGRVLQAAADKDLTQRLKFDYIGEYARMKENINTLVKNLDEAMGQVTEATYQVLGASSEISNGAQSLAEGANQQASSLEEVSSSLEEMSSMTKQNAENSNQALILASEASTAARDGDTTIRRMANAINQIKQSADNTAKIVKSIDDIAFQTNLLALNAAVEAARAGEAGKGFAVVAEEVRNLAMRSADAAKSTADMIDESVKNAEGGVKITEEVAVSLSQIVNRTSKVSDLIAEIAAASKEQAQGIEQVNVAVAQMNQVTQRNAANSEESASASEELSAQATELSNMVSAFNLSSSASANKNPQSYQPVSANARADKADRRIGGGENKGVRENRIGTERRGIVGNPSDRRVPATAKPFVPKLKSPEEIIPLNDEAFMAFL